ncbi:MAG: hypothetical protein FIA98_06815 [Anaerolineae bacterium]|nr:hypothetical protein [Anaerolineae bacterium]
MGIAHLEGQTLGGRYQVQSLIGHGMGDEDFARLIVLQAMASGLRIEPERVAVHDGLSPADQ